MNLKVLILTLATSALVADSLMAADFGINIPMSAFSHPISSIRKTPKSVLVRRITVGVMEGLNYADYHTTSIGVIHGPYCENNPLFQGNGPCSFNRSRFVHVKLAVAAFGFAQEVPELFQSFRGWHGRIAWEQSMGILNAIATVPLGIAVVNNEKVLRGK